VAPALLAKSSVEMGVPPVEPDTSKLYPRSSCRRGTSFYRGGHMRWVVIVSAALSVSPALAAPIHLECKGQTNVYEKGMFSPTEETVSVTLDFALGSVTVGSRAGKWTVPMVNRPNEDMVTTAHREVGVTMGSINRITGAASFGFAMAPGFSIFKGVCQRAPEYLF
jgi:hypothetical protein